jgi:catechol 2,3-dioxygenase-like lactoylglutathione lyase family enzyme
MDALSIVEQKIETSVRGGRIVSMDAQVRYVAIVCDQPRQVADFYKDYFGMQPLGDSTRGDISVTDGWVNFSLLQREPGSKEPCGLGHIGVAINDLDEFKSRLKAVAPNTAIEEDKADLHSGEYRIHDPNGIPVSISLRNFGMKGAPAATDRRLRHVSFTVPTGQPLLEYYTRLFGFREVSASIKRRESGRDAYPFYFCGDGEMNFGLLPIQLLMDRTKRPLTETHRVQGWFDHIGFVVSDMSSYQRRIGGEKAGVDMAEFRIHDPEKNQIDLSEKKGFEVDYDKWARAA